MTPKFHALQVTDLTKETEDTVSIAFEIPSSLKEDYKYLPGQYLTIKKIINGTEVRRSYSLCSAPYENEWRVAVKSIENGLFSNFANNELKVGETLEVMTPTGNFNLKTDPDSNKSYALFASGSGITPILSIAKTILKNEPESDVTLFYGNKNFGSIIFRETIEALKNQFMDRLRVVHILSRENLGNEIQKGRITKDKADKLFKVFLSQGEINDVFICGPEEMILGVKESMIENGIDPKAVHFELFTTPGIKKTLEKVTSDEPEIKSNVSVILDGDTYDLPMMSSGESLLDAAQKAGADLPYACKGGVCCTCKAKILEGSARMDVNYALEKEEVEAGYILTCQAHPTSEKLIVSFDE